jgi:tetratricopeptide (TPR) repeat protein
LRRYPDVIAQAEPLVLEESDDVHLMYLLAFAYNQVGRPEDAIRIFTKLGRSEKNSPAPRQIIDVESNLILADAYAAAGNTDKARVFADRYLYEAHLDSDDWWSHFYSACSHGILGDKERALERLSRVPDSPRMPWNYLLRDMLCFSSLQDDPRYQEILQRFDERRADVRRHLPVTLRRYGVTL